MDMPGPTVISAMIPAVTLWAWILGSLGAGGNGRYSGGWPGMVAKSCDGVPGAWPDTIASAGVGKVTDRGLPVTGSIS